MSEEIYLHNGWEICTLNEIAEGENSIVDGPFGSNLKTSDYIDDNIKGIPVLTTKNLEGDYSDNKVRFISQSKFEQVKRSMVKPYDIIVAKIGSVGKNGIYPKNGKIAIIPANLLKFTVSKNINLKYVYFYINFFEFQKKIKAISTATAQPAFNLSKFRNLLIPLPPRQEQHRIVNKLDELFSSLDKGIESLKTAQEQLKVYRQAVLKWAFEGKLNNRSVQEGKLPDGWKVEELKDLTIKAKKIKSKEQEPNTEFIYLDIGAIDNSIMKITNPKIIQWKNAPSRAQQIVEIGDTLFSTVRTYLKNIAFIDKGIYHNQICSSGFTVIRANKKIIEPKFLFFYSTYQGFISPLNRLQTGTSYPAVRDEDVIGQQINYPVSIEEQQFIISEIENRLSICDKIEESIKTSLLKAEALRQSILKKAFEGRLVPQDPSDEPASVLLKRIKAERENDNPVKKVNAKKLKVGKEAV